MRAELEETKMSQQPSSMRRFRTLAGMSIFEAGTEAETGYHLGLTVYVLEEVSRDRHQKPDVRHTRNGLIQIQKHLAALTRLKNINTCNQINVLMTLPHMFFKQVDDGCQSRWVLQNGTDVSTRQKVCIKMQSFECHLKSQKWTCTWTGSSSLGPGSPEGWTNRRSESSPLFFPIQHLYPSVQCLLSVLL